MLPADTIPIPVEPEAAASRWLELPGGVAGRGGAVGRRVRVRALTGADEEILFDRGRSGSALVTAFLSRVVERVDGVDEPVDEALVAGMYLGDRDYLLLRLRQMELGDAVHEVTRCGSCGNRVDVDFAISELPVRRLDAPGPAYRVSLTADGGRELLVRLPTGADQEAIEDLALRNPAAANTRLFSRLVLEVDGRGPVTEEDARRWSPALRAELASWLDAHAPGPSLYLDLACPQCRADMSYVFDLHGFFLPSGHVDSTGSSKRST